MLLIHAYPVKMMLPVAHVRDSAQREDREVRFCCSWLLKIPEGSHLLYLKNTDGCSSDCV